MNYAVYENGKKLKRSIENRSNSIQVYTKMARNSRDLKRIDQNLYKSTHKWQETPDRSVENRSKSIQVYTQMARNLKDL